MYVIVRALQVIVGSVLVAANFASAQPFSVAASAGTRITYPDAALNPTASDDLKEFYNTTLPSVLVPMSLTSTVPTQPGASASAAVTASEGVFHGFATAYHAETGDSYYSEAVVSATAFESGTLGMGLPVGTPVLENFSIVLTGSFTPSDCGCGGSFAAEAIATLMVASNTGPGLSLRFDTASTGNVLSGVVAGLAGDQISMSQAFNLLTYVNGIQYLGSHPDTATTDYSNTVHFYADSLTPGAAFVSASGHDYSTPVAAVPEPGPGAMLLSGLTLIGFFARRRG